MSLLLAIALGALGGTFGSFIALATARMPKGSPLTGRSRCDHCAYQLRWFELFPVLSFIAQKGRCRTCNAAIGTRQIVIELLALVIGVTAAMATPLPLCIWVASLGWLLLTLAILDLEHFWLPDKLVLVVLISGIAQAALLDPTTVAERLIGCGAGFAMLEAIRRAYAVLRKREGMGAGDPKMLAAIGAWAGWQQLPFVLLGACLIGLTWVGGSHLFGKRINPAAPLPFGTMLAVAGFAATLIALQG